LAEEEMQLLHAQENPILGWYSPAYGIKQGSCVLQSRKVGTPESMSFITAICTENCPERKELEGRACSL